MPMKHCNNKTATTNTKLLTCMVEHEPTYHSVCKNTVSVWSSVIIHECGISSLMEFDQYPPICISEVPSQPQKAPSSDHNVSAAMNFRLPNKTNLIYIQ